MKKKIFTLLAVFAIFGATQAQKLTIKPVAKAPLMDGIVDDNDPWGETWIKLEKANTANSTTAMSAEVQIGYDQKNLYFVAKVVDGTRNVDNATAHTNDCVEFFIAMDTTSGDGTYKKGDFQIRKIVSKDVEAKAGATVAEVDNSSDYVQEWSLPWDSLTAGMETAWNRIDIKIDWQVADATADGERTQQQYWNDNSDLQWSNTNKFGWVKLEYPLAVKNVSSSKASAYLSGNIIKVSNVSGEVNVYDVTGKMVVKTIINNSGNINVSALKSGLYIVKASNLSAKIIK